MTIVRDTKDRTWVLVRDVHVRYLSRLDRMLTECDPLYDNWDQDASAVERRYDEQRPSDVTVDSFACYLLHDVEHHMWGDT